MRVVQLLCNRNMKAFFKHNKKEEVKMKKLCLLAFAFSGSIFVVNVVVIQFRQW